MGFTIEYTLDFYFTLVAQTNATRMFMIGGYTWVVYDWLITLDQEIEYVWRKPGGLQSKLLYAFTRYYGIAFLTYDLIVLTGSWGPKFCHDYFFILGGGGFALMFAAEGALQMRVYVLYNCDKRVLIFNAIFFFLEGSTMVILYLMDTILYKPVATPGGLTGCWSTSLNIKYTIGVWWLCLAFESWLSFLVVRKAYSKYREFGVRSHVLGVLIRDSLIWFLLLAACLLYNAIAFLAAPPGLLLTGIPIVHASATIGASRLLLNLRSAYFGGQHDTMVATDEGSLAYKFATEGGRRDPRRPNPNNQNDLLFGGTTTLGEDFPEGGWATGTRGEGEGEGDGTKSGDFDGNGDQMYEMRSRIGASVDEEQLRTPDWERKEFLGLQQPSPTQPPRSPSQLSPQRRSRRSWSGFVEDWSLNRQTGDTDPMQKRLSPSPRPRASGSGMGYRDDERRLNQQPSRRQQRSEIVTTP